MADPMHSTDQRGSRSDSRPEIAPLEPWIDVDDLAVALRVSTDWVYEKAASGVLPSYKFGGHRRFRVSEVETWALNCANGKMARAAGEETRRR